VTPVVYLHGLASGPSSIKARYFRAGLERAGRRVEVPDLAEGDFEHLTISRQLAVLERTAAGEPVTLIGSSMGGYLAALYAARHPEVRCLVLLAPAFGFGRLWAMRLGCAGIEHWRTTGYWEVYHYAFGRNCRLAYDLMTDASGYEDEPDFRQPALIFHGAADDVVPPRYSEQFAALRPNARLEIVDSGHDLLNALDAIWPKVLAFLS
jgi:uncharacterized protein